MSLTIILRSCTNLKGKSDRLAKITFRGVTYQSSIYENCSEANWDEAYEWPLASALDPSEFIEVEVYNFNKVFNNRLVGVFRMILQRLIQDKSVDIQENLVDSNNTILKAQVSIKLLYDPPDGGAVDAGLQIDMPPGLDGSIEPLVDNNDNSSSVTSFRAMTEAERTRSHLSLQESNRPAGRPIGSMPNIPMHFTNGGITQDIELSPFKRKKDSSPAIRSRTSTAGALSIIAPFEKKWRSEQNIARESFDASEVKGTSEETADQ